MKEEENVVFALYVGKILKNLSLGLNTDLTSLMIKLCTLFYVYLSKITIEKVRLATDSPNLYYNQA